MIKTMGGMFADLMGTWGFLNFLENKINLLKLESFEGGSNVKFI